MIRYFIRGYDTRTDEMVHETEVSYEVWWDFDSKGSGEHDAYLMDNPGFTAGPFEKYFVEREEGPCEPD
jgi:hypothetical protein